MGWLNFLLILPNMKLEGKMKGILQWERMVECSNLRRNPRLEEGAVAGEGNGDLLSFFRALIRVGRSRRELKSVALLEAVGLAAQWLRVNQKVYKGAFGVALIRRNGDRVDVKINF